jgi:hypothetical protein
LAFRLPAGRPIMAGVSGIAHRKIAQPHNVIRRFDALNTCRN